MKTKLKAVWWIVQDVRHEVRVRATTDKSAIRKAVRAGRVTVGRTTTARFWRTTTPDVI